MCCFHSHSSFIGWCVCVFSCFSFFLWLRIFFSRIQYFSLSNFSHFLRWRSVLPWMYSHLKLCMYSTFVYILLWLRCSLKMHSAQCCCTQDTIFGWLFVGKMHKRTQIYKTYSKIRDTIYKSWMATPRKLLRSPFFLPYYCCCHHHYRHWSCFFHRFSEMFSEIGLKTFTKNR